MSNSIPEKAVRKQAELCKVILSHVEEAVARGIPADHAIGRLYRQHREFGSRDRRFFSNLVFSWFRWRGWLTSPDRPGDIITAHLLDARTVHPAIERLAKLSGWQHGQEALFGKSLVEKAGKAGTWLGLSRPLNVEKLVPSWTGECLFLPDGTEREEHFLRCVEAFQSRPPIWVRVKKSRAGQIAGTRGGEHALSCAGRAADTGEMEKLKQRHGADIEIQDIASQCAGFICAPIPGERWWDVCAGAGGKALHLADIMGSGMILATDIRKSALDECVRRARRSGARPIKCRSWDGTRDPYPGILFDGALVDAPCSGIGTWHRNPDARWRTAREIIEERAGAQLRLLNTAAEKIKPGGRLVYSVCTLTYAESIGVVNGFLKNHPAFRLMDTPHPVSGGETDGMIWIWPWLSESNGMFIAHLQKREGDSLNPGA